MKLSTSEKEFIRKNINYRINTRGNNVERETKIFSKNHIPQSDASVILSRGDSILEIILKFKENVYILNRVLNENIAIQNEKMIILEGDIIEMENFGLIDFLQKNGMFSIVIETKIIQNDGNINDLFYYGIGFLLKNIDLSYTNEFNMYEIPVCRSYAVFDEFFVVDPDFSEENSCDAIVRVFLKNKCIERINVDKCKRLDPFILSEIINCI